MGHVSLKPMSAEFRAELKKVAQQVKKARTQANAKLTTFLKEQLKDNKWIDDARQVAQAQGKEVKKLINADIKKVKSFVEREKKQLERLQRDLPKDVKKLRTFVDVQRKEVERLLKSLRTVGVKRAVGRSVARRSVKARTKKKTRTTKSTRS